MKLTKENWLQTLGKKLMAAGKAGLFDTWMMQESDLVQAAARAFGERLISDQVSKQNKMNKNLVSVFLIISYQLSKQSKINKKLSFSIFLIISPYKLVL